MQMEESHHITGGESGDMVNEIYVGL